MSGAIGIQNACPSKNLKRNISFCILEDPETTHPKKDWRKIHKRGSKQAASKIINLSPFFFYLTCSLPCPHLFIKIKQKILQKKNTHRTHTSHRKAKIWYMVTLPKDMLETLSWVLAVKCFNLSPQVMSVLIQTWPQAWTFDYPIGLPDQESSNVVLGLPN